MVPSSIAPTVTKAAFWLTNECDKEVHDDGSQHGQERRRDHFANGGNG